MADELIEYGFDLTKIEDFWPVFSRGAFKKTHFNQDVSDFMVQIYDSFNILFTNKEYMMTRKEKVQ